MEAPPSGAGEVGEAIFLVLRFLPLVTPGSLGSPVAPPRGACSPRPHTGGEVPQPPRSRPRPAPPPQSARGGCPLGSPGRSPGRSPSPLPAPTYLPAGRLRAMADQGRGRPWPRGWAGGCSFPAPRAARVNVRAAGLILAAPGGNEAASLAAAATAGRAMSSWTAPRNMSICTTDCWSLGGGWGEGGSSAGAPASQADVLSGGPRPLGRRVQLFPAHLHTHWPLSIHTVHTLPGPTHSPLSH